LEYLLILPEKCKYPGVEREKEKYGALARPSIPPDE